MTATAVKITDLPVATQLTMSDVIPVVQGGVTKQAQFSLFPDPSVDWVDITDKPTTLMGFGITDAVPSNRVVSAGTGLTGGGALNGDITLSIGATGVSAATYGDATHAVILAVNAQGQITSVSVALITPAFASLTGKPTTLAGYGITDGVVSSRQVATTNSLTGGGDLSADLTLKLVNDAAAPGNSKYYGTDSGGTRGWFTLGAGTGSVTSVDMTVPSILSVSGAPITTTGTLAVALATQTANQIFVGPTSGGAATPAFRAMVPADLPNTAVTPGSYTYSSITVDAQGRVTAAASGTAPAPSGSTTQVQFNNAGAFAGDANFAWDGTQILLSNASAIGTIAGKAVTNSVGTSVKLLGADGNGANFRGGGATIQGGVGKGTQRGGAAQVTGGDSTAGSGNGGAAQITGGTGSSTGIGGEVDITGGAVVAGGTAGGVVIATGAVLSSTATPGDITLTLTDTGTKGLLKLNGAAVANGSVATALTSLGPVGSHTTVQKWLKVNFDGTTGYIPVF